MAVFKMKKVYLIGHQSLSSILVDTLQKQGLLHLTNLREKIAPKEVEEELAEPKLKEFEHLQSKVRFVLDFLKQFEQKRKGFLASLIREKIKVGWERFARIQEKINFEILYERCRSLEGHFESIENELSQLKTVKEDLEPWAPLNISFKHLKETEQTATFIGQMRAEEFKKFQPELEQMVEESYLNVVSQDFRGTNFLLLFHKKRLEAVNSLLYKFGFRPSSFPELEGTPKQELQNIEKRITQLGKERKERIKQAKELAFLKADLLILQDFLENKLAKIKVSENFAQSKEAFMIEGWVPEEKKEEFQRKVSQISEEIELAFLVPSEGEKPPIILKNHPLIRPFELLTKLYGLPDYNEVDPTFSLALFFSFFFGIAIGDFGYGLTLAFVSWLLSKKLEVSENVKRFFQLLIYGGVSSMVVGIFTGGYFGIDPLLLPSFLRKLILLEPLNEAMLFLGLTCLLGLSHVLLGLILAGVNNSRQNGLKIALFEQGTTVLFILSFLTWLTLWLMKVASPTFFEPLKNFYPLSINALGLSTLAVVFFQGRVFASKSLMDVIKRLATGLYRLYGMLSFIGNILSYVRLMALGLATFLMGWVINMLLGRFFSLSLWGIIFLPLILVVLLGAHLLNILINLLGAVVHPLRLQYVEFFSQFYKGGGRKYEPFSIQTRYLTFKPGEG